MPAWTTWAPWRIPFHIAIFLVPCFPQREVANAFLIVFVVLHAPRRLQLGEIEVRELSVIGKFVDAKIDRLVVGLIREAFRNECADHRDHPVDVTLVSRTG